MNGMGLVLGLGQLGLPSMMMMIVTLADDELMMMVMDGMGVAMELVA